jgi:uncharacterized membrane protein
VLYLSAFLIGISAGLRSFTAPAVVSWAARLGWMKLSGTPLAFLGATATPWILTAAALFELVADKSRWIPSRKSPPSFAGRIVSGVLCGLALGASGGAFPGGIGTAVAGASGVVVGTLGGYEFRARLTRAAGGRGFPIAVLEDAIAIGLAVWAVYSVGRL